MYTLEYFKPTFPHFKPQGVKTDYLDQKGIDFLFGLLAINPDTRMTVK
jgi:hypothetical protein